MIKSHTVHSLWKEFGASSDLMLETPYMFLAIWNVVFNLGWVTSFARESLEPIEPNKISFRICGSVQDVITVLCHLESIGTSCPFLSVCVLVKIHAFPGIYLDQVVMLRQVAEVHISRQYSKFSLIFKESTILY